MFLLHRWNKKYGNGAKFIVEDKSTGKFAEFSPARPKDIQWVDKNITTESEYQSWDDFQKEPVENLNDIVM